MVNLNKWEEVDFFDVDVFDNIKAYIKRGPILTEIVTGKVHCTEFKSDQTEGKIRLVKDGETHLLFRDPAQGKPEGTTLYRRKQLTQDEKDEQFKFPEKLGAIVSAVPRQNLMGRYPSSERVNHVWDGGEWSTAHTSISTGELRAEFKEYKLVRDGIDL